MTRPASRPRPAAARRRARRGFTLVELLTTLLVFGVVTAAGFGYLASQSRSFRTMSERSGLVQNVRFGRDLLRQEIRTTGTNVTDLQPMIAYASDSVYAFNADLTTNVEDSVALTGAVYVDPYAPDSAVGAMRAASATAIPGSSPAFGYPLADYSQNTQVFINSDAETITFWFAPDTTTTAAGDYLLLRRVNRMQPEILLRGVRRRAGRPFFRYWYDPSRYGAVNATLDTVPRAWLPLAKTVASRGLAPDTGTSPTTRIDQLRAVEVNYEVVSQSGTTVRSSLVNYMVPLPNTVRPRLRRICGRVPLFGRSVEADYDGPSGSEPAGIDVEWDAAVDQTGGERDVVRYVVWRREAGTIDWGEPHVTVAATSATEYRWRDTAGEPGRSYQYAVAVQDCTPNVSTLSLSNTESWP